MVPSSAIYCQDEINTIINYILLYNCTTEKPLCFSNSLTTNLRVLLWTRDLIVWINWKVSGKRALSCKDLIVNLQKFK